MNGRQDVSQSLLSKEIIVIGSCCYYTYALDYLIKNKTQYEPIYFSNLSDFKNWDLEKNGEVIDEPFLFVMFIKNDSQAWSDGLIEYFSSPGSYENKYMLICEDRLVDLMSSLLHYKGRVLISDKISINNFCNLLEKFCEVKLNDCHQIINENITREKIKLSAGEKKAISLYLKGLFSQNNKGVSTKTLYAQRSSAMKKLGINSCLDIIRYNKIIEDLILSDQQICQIRTTT